MASILIGVSGGIAAYKAVHLVRLATTAGHGVRVLMTPTAGRFVGAPTFEGISGAPVLVDEFDEDPMRGAFPGTPLPEHAPISHLALAERADAFVVAPASANTIAKLAGGICDSMLATSFLACRAPRLIAPAMNGRMWEDGATRDNVAILRRRGIRVMEPGVGELASRGERGVGRMPEPEEILTELEGLVATPPDRDLDGVRVLITAGGTREPIDSVRFIGNRSSGRMGFAIAEEAASRGATVSLIAANVALPTPPGVERLDVTGVSDLAASARQRFPGVDVLLMAAAVSDFRPESAEAGKIVREGAGEMELRLVPTEDVLAALARTRSEGQTIVGFAAEHGGDFVARARAKLERKGADIVVVNDVSAAGIGFESGSNEVTIVDRAGEEHVPRTDKRAIARAILDHVVRTRGSGDGRVS